jgi:hypothetical protein
MKQEEFLVPEGISCKRCKRNCNIDCMEHIRVEEVLKKLKDIL